jgi:hypothetical protein
LCSAHFASVSCRVLELVVGGQTFAESVTVTTRMRVLIVDDDVNLRIAMVAFPMDDG